MKKLAVLLCFLFSLSVVSALDIRQEAVHVINDDATSTANYTDFFYGEFAEEILGQLKQVSQLELVKTLFPIKVNFYSINSSGDSVMIKAAGDYPNFVKKDGPYYVVGAFLLDGYCLSPTTSVIPKTVREFSVYYDLPQNWTLISIPDNATKNMKNFFYNFTTQKEGSRIRQNIFLDVAGEVSLNDYCQAINSINLLQKEFLADAHLMVHASLIDLAIVFTTFVFLLFGFRYVVGK